MTLTELIIKAIKAAEPFTSSGLPLKLEGKDVEIDFKAEGNNEDGYVINMIIKQ